MKVRILSHAFLGPSILRPAYSSSTDTIDPTVPCQTKDTRLGLRPSLLEQFFLPDPRHQDREHNGSGCRY